MEKHKTGPFTLWVSLAEPHSTYDFMLEEADAFDSKSFAVPALGPNDPPQIPLIFRDLSLADKQGIAAACYTSVRYMGRNIGIVLKKLKDLGLEKNTLVDYMSDHGIALASMAGSRNIVSRPPQARKYIFSEYMENEEACVRTGRWKFIQCSSRRARTDGCITDNPTPGRYLRLNDQLNDPSEMTDVSAEQPAMVAWLSNTMLERSRATHPEAGKEPDRLQTLDAIDWYLRPRDRPV